MTNRTVYNLFVYGSLRSGFQSPAYEYVSRYFSLVGNARVKGKLYDMGEFPAGVPADADAWISGELYQISNPQEFSWAMGQLDDYEGVFAEPGETSHYYRALTTVVCNDMELEAWIYWYRGDVNGRPVISSGDMLEYLRSKNP
ncbi:MAG: gamma-glutamylcyclotransferase [Chitinophagaceae bacterium]|nr:gamma-glutamylcyclotransferase [Chitinophagaceae bacterium]